MHCKLMIVFAMSVCLAVTISSNAQDFQPFSYGWGDNPGDKGYSDTETHTGLMITPTLSDFGQPALTTENLYDRLYTVRLAVTNESVYGGHALRVNFDQGATPALLFHYEVVTAAKLPETTGGLTFYVAASHPMTLKVSQNWQGSDPYPAEFSVTTSWQKIEIPKSYLTSEWIPFYIFATEAQTSSGYLLIDRIGAEDPFVVDPPLAIAPNTDASIASSELFIGSQFLDDFRTRLQNQEELTIFGWGDSISAGARINQSTTDHPLVGRGWSGHVDDRFFSRLAAKLREHYGYEEITAVEKALGGTQIVSPESITFKEEILSEASPGDLVIIEFGANDMNFDVSPTLMAERIGDAVDEFFAAGLNVVVITPPVCEQWDMVDAALEPSLTTAMIQLSIEKQVTVVNLLKFLTYRGNEFAFAVESNNCHPSFWGHELMGQLLYATVIDASFEWSPENDFPQRQFSFLLFEDGFESGTTDAWSSESVN